MLCACIFTRKQAMTASPQAIGGANSAREWSIPRIKNITKIQKWWLGTPAIKQMSQTTILGFAPTLAVC
jgi:hypothetical protein